MADMKEIKEGIAAGIRRLLGTEYLVAFHSVEKDNGITLLGVTAHGPEERTSPMVYIDSLVKEIKDGTLDIPEVVERIADTWRTGCAERGKAEAMARSMDKAWILERVTYRLIGLERNRKRLAGVQYQRFLDLAAVCQVEEVGEKGESLCITVTDGICSEYGISTEELHGAALRNTQNREFHVQSLTEMMEPYASPDTLQKAEQLPEMWILWNGPEEGGPAATDGAAVMLRENVFHDLAEKAGSDLYILPSSICEVLAVQACEGDDVKQLREMVADINRRMIRPEEVLGDSVYHYSREDGCITIA